MNIDFTKYVASGNDFIAIDNRSGSISSLIYDLAKDMCARKFSVGADGLLVLEDSSSADIKMRIINPDGSEVEMCGNGLRCIALFAKELGVDKDNCLSIETIAGIMKASINDISVKAMLSEPRDAELEFDISLSGENLKSSFINSGVPHVVTLLDNIDDLDIKSLGSAIRYHDKFKPQGANANFIKVLDKNTIKIRTYERGVEDETLACGTGAVASSIVGFLLGVLDSPIKVNTKSGEILTISFTNNNSKISDLSIEGKVQKVYNGRYEHV